jgi:hypothetical protein
METRDIFIFGFILIFLGFRLYQKYYKKGTGKGNTGTNNSAPTRSAFSESSKDDDYEPYLKK